MNEDERKLHQNIVRVGMNLGVLLDIGLFPGKHALGLEECKGFVSSIVNDASAKLQALTPPPDAPPSFPPAGAPAPTAPPEATPPAAPAPAA